jgi:2-polyprenyl-3-methyl-5-hydroxy-6-metoxy-1,4-benzoquinol methylase
MSLDLGSEVMRISKEIKTLLKETSLYPFSSVLDVGLGDGTAANYFLSMGCEVTAIGFDTKNYRVKKALYNSIKVHDGVSVENMKVFKDNSFDAAWCSNIIEHTHNPQTAIKELIRVVKPNGYLFITVPPYKENISGGHVSTGWNLLTLMYNLVIAGVDTNYGHFIRWWDNVVAFQKNVKIDKMPELRHDNGDLEKLQPYFPVKVYNGRKTNFQSVNWEWFYYKPNFRQKLRDALIGKTYKLKFLEVRLL